MAGLGHVWGGIFGGSGDLDIQEGYEGREGGSGVTPRARRRTGCSRGRGRGAPCGAGGAGGRARRRHHYLARRADGTIAGAGRWNFHVRFRHPGFCDSLARERYEVKKFLAVLAIMGFFLLGSSPGPCCTGGDPYSACYDLSDDFSSRWANGRGQFAPQWTQDGSQIVFGHAGRIFLIDTDGSDIRSLSGSLEPAHAYSETAEIDFSPSISPKGDRIAFTTLRFAKGGLSEHTYEIATMAMDGSDIQRLTSNTWDDVNPAWSPDGSLIAFVSVREGVPRVVTVTPDGSELHNVAPTVTASTLAPVWSPDGSKLAFVAREIEQGQIPYLKHPYPYQPDATPAPAVYDGTIVRHILYVVGSDGSGLTRLEWADERNPTPRQRARLNDVSLPEEDVSLPSWSPDGTRLAFSAAYYGELSALYSIRADGSNVQRLFKHPDIDYPEIANIHRVSWTADGSGLRFISTGYLRIDADSVRSLRGDHLADVSTGRLLDSRELPWKWGSPYHMSWSPDGYTIAIHTSEENLYQAQSEDAGIVLHTDSANGSGKRVLVRREDNLLVASGP